MAIGYVIVEIYEAWNYDETTVYDQATSERGLFAQYMNTFIKIKMEAYGYPVGCTTAQEKTAFIGRVRAHEGIPLSYDDIVYNAGRHTVAKLCLNNIWGKFAQNSDRCTKEFVTDPRKFFELIFDDTYDVSDAQIINDDCLYVTYKKSKGFQTPALNTNVIIASYVTTHARLELYSYLERYEGRALYCDTASIIYRYVEGMYNPPLSEFVGGMTNEKLYYGVRVQRTKELRYRTGDGKQVVKDRGFTLNCVASQQLTFDVMNKMAISEQEEHIIVTESRKIRKDEKRRQINTSPSSKLYQRIFDKKCATLTSTHDYRTDMCNNYVYI